MAALRTGVLPLTLATLAMIAAPARAHWMRPEDIVAGLASDARLRDELGVVAVQIQADLPRLLVIKVDRVRWEAAAPQVRITLAEEWLETWRHNVPEGIVAVLDRATDQSVVNFDGLGHAQLRVTPAVPTPGG